MATNEYLQSAIDLGTQAKFPYTTISTPGYSNGDVLYSIFEHFGVIVVQANNGVTISMPGIAAGTSGMHYLRQISSADSSSYAFDIDLGGGDTITLAPGDTRLIFWDGAYWKSFPSPRSEMVQGRLEALDIRSYLIIRGGDEVKYIDRIYLNVDSGSGEVGVLHNGLAVTTSNIQLVAGTESQYTFSPKLQLLDTGVLSLNFSKLINLEGVHYRVDIDDSL